MSEIVVEVIKTQHQRMVDAGEPDIAHHRAKADDRHRQIAGAYRHLADRMRGAPLGDDLDDIGETVEQIYQLFPILAEKKDQLAGELSGGQRQQVAVGRALMSQPKVLMLDEPTAGVSPIVMDELFDRILEVRETGVAILMVEQNARQALHIADRGFVLVIGENRHTDTGVALLADPEVRRSFLGG